jgi:hypothetical protein
LKIVDFFEANNPLWIFIFKTNFFNFFQPMILWAEFVNLIHSTKGQPKFQ